jgi:hypothetical protein
MPAFREYLEFVNPETWELLEQPLAVTATHH